MKISRINFFYLFLNCFCCIPDKARSAFVKYFSRFYAFLYMPSCMRSIKLRILEKKYLSKNTVSSQIIDSSPVKPVGAITLESKVEGLIQ